jgi:hypothetical protein
MDQKKMAERFAGYAAYILDAVGVNGRCPAGKGAYACWFYRDDIANGLREIVQLEVRRRIEAMPEGGAQ